MQSQWDLETQEFHGGQSWRSCHNFVDDFSVTTNASAPPTHAVEAAAKALCQIHHYPSSDATIAKSALSKFCQWPSSKMLLGNGASEFIDLVMKVLPEAPFSTAPYMATYQEYHRAAKAAHRRVIAPPNCALLLDNNNNNNTSPDSEQGDPQPAKVHPGERLLVVYIRPNSPTGEMISLSEIDTLLTENPNWYMIIDESFLCFAGSTWRKLSALNLVDKFSEQLVIIQSWTKVWSCAGLRLGSVCASESWIKEFKRYQTPWSCNSIAQAFAVEAARDKTYLSQTWSYVEQWRALTLQNIDALGLGWKVFVNERTVNWIPWVLVECATIQQSSRANKVALSVGCPIRYCASYGLPKFIRIAVRHPDHQRILFDALSDHFHEKISV